MKCERPFCLQTLFLLAAGWFLLSLFAGETELLATLPAAAPQITIVGLSVVLLGGYFGVRSFRTAVDGWPLRVLIAVHLTRFVGVYFLVLSAKGALDPRFAVPAGWGDIVIALGAAVLLFVQPPRWLLLTWNSLGLLDIMLVVARAAYLRLNNASGLDALTRLPLSFLPTMIVPLIIASHVVIYARCLSGGLKTEADSAVVGAGMV